MCVAWKGLTLLPLFSELEGTWYKVESHWRWRMFMPSGVGLCCNWEPRGQTAVFTWRPRMEYHPGRLDADTCVWGVSARSPAWPCLSLALSYPVSKAVSSSWPWVWFWPLDRCSQPQLAPYPTQTVCLSPPLPRPRCPWLSYALCSRLTPLHPLHPLSRHSNCAAGTALPSQRHLISSPQKVQG